MKAMILGSSHISNLDAYLRTNFEMILANHEIRIKGFRGGNGSYNVQSISGC